MRLHHLWNSRVVLAFAFAGPLGGLLAFLVLSGAIRDMEWSLDLYPTFLLWGGAAYAAGLLPATATGLLASALWSLRLVLSQWWIRVIAGAGLGYGVMLAWQHEYLGGSSGFGDPYTFALVGASGGALAGLIAGSWVAPNNSFKPTPLRGAA